MNPAKAEKKELTGEELYAAFAHRFRDERAKFYQRYARGLQVDVNRLLLYMLVEAADRTLPVIPAEPVP